MRTWAAIALVSVVGCGAPKADNWAAKASKAECDYALRCDQANFFYVYQDEKDCRSVRETEWQAVADATCEFDSDSAKACLKALDQSCKEIGQDYDALIAPCLTVWSCPNPHDSFDTAAPTAAPL